MRKVYEQKRETVDYKNRLLEMEAKALSSQMNPHFIYNSLSTVQHLIIIDEKQKAFDFLSDFSLLMRQMLNNSRKVQISLEDEIDFLKRYIELEKFRFGNHFNYEFNLDGDLSVNSCSIPSMFIQPIIENAIKHGLAPKKEKGLLKINFTVQNDILECTIDDNGIGWKEGRSGISPIKHESTALSIIKERLNLIKSYADHTGRLEIINKLKSGINETGTVVKIFIPILNSL
jgi:sensor histidine kinase YesM